MKDQGKKEVVIMAGVLILMAIIFLSIIGKPQPWIRFLDEANLLIHESGHVFFSGGGELIGALGGTFMQLLVPLFFVGYFYYKKDLMATSFGIFWTGQNLVNISIYIKDARTKLLPLINEGTHDWNIILSLTNSLSYDTKISGMVRFLGTLIMFMAILWGVIIVFNKLKERAATPILS